MEVNKGTDLNKFILTENSLSSKASKKCNEDNFESKSIRRIPSLPQLKPHFIVTEYCGRPRLVPRNGIPMPSVYVQLHY